MLQYAALHLSGYDLSLDDLEQFRQWGSRTPGHPELVRGESSRRASRSRTGPLGQGVGNAVGMALAEAMLAARFNGDGEPLVDHRTYAICSDGDVMEGVSGEASSLAGFLGLGKLCLIYDDNHITIEGSTGLAFGEDVGRRYEAYGFHVQRLDDGWSTDDLRAGARRRRRRDGAAVADHRAHAHRDRRAARAGHRRRRTARRSARRRCGSPSRPTAGIPTRTFYVPDEVYAHFVAARARAPPTTPPGTRVHDAQLRGRSRTRRASSTACSRGSCPTAGRTRCPTSRAPTPQATRVSSGACIAALAAAIPELVGRLGRPRALEQHDDQGRRRDRGRTARQQGERPRRLGAARAAWAAARCTSASASTRMGAILNGLAVHGGFRAFGATFFVFSDYMRPAVRLACIMGLPVIYVWTHDSIGLGEDGPTHQPIEHLASLRAMPHMRVIRPADATETVEAWRLALERTRRPGRPRALAPEAAGARPRDARAGERRAPRRLRARRRRTARPT